MIALALRLAIGLALLIACMYSVDLLLGTDVFGAIGRIAIWFWVGIVDLAARAAGKVSLTLAKLIRTFGQKALIRRLSQPLWRVSIAFLALFVIGKARRDRAEAWLERQRSRLAHAVKSIADFKPDWPRNVRAAIAISVISLFLLLFFWISENIGKWWGLGASIILWMMVEKINLIGLDALIMFLVEKWAPVKAFIDRHPWVRWIWLGPVFDWLANSVESFSERHADKHGGRSSLEVWRERRRKLKRQRGSGKHYLQPVKRKPTWRHITRVFGRGRPDDAPTESQSSIAPDSGAGSSERSVPRPAGTDRAHKDET